MLFSKNHSRYVIKTVNVENGLINNSVTDVVTDTFGFTWISTKTGLQRYNGYALETIHPIINGKEIIINHEVQFLRTKNNDIWIAYNNEILVYNPYRNIFKSLLQNSSKDSNNNSPVHFLQDSNDGVWCVMNNNFLLYSYAGKIIKTSAFPSSVALPTIISNGFYFSSNKQNIFIITRSEQVVQFNKQTGIYTFLTVKNETLYGLACTESKLYILHSKGISVTNINADELPAIHSILNVNRPFTGTIKAFNNEILVSINQHLLILDSGCRKATEITTLTNNPVISAGFINHIYEDQFNRLWLLTNDDIKIVQDYKIPYQYYAYPNATNFIKSIYVDEANNVILAGCFNGGLQLFDTLNNPLWQKPLITNQAKDIMCIEKISPDTYFLETLGQGWYICKLSAKKIIPLHITETEENELHTHTMSFPNNIQRIDSNNLIVTTTTDVIQCAFEKDQLSHYSILFHTSFNNAINCFYYDEINNKLWIGSNTGMLYCKYRNGSVTTFNIQTKFHVRSITSDAAGNTWVGTDKGLFVYNKNNDIIKQFSTSNGLLNDCIYSMLTDAKKETIYASSNMGLSVLNIRGVLKNYTRESGLQENEFNTSSTAKTAGGKLFFGGVNGITAFYPGNLTSESDHPSLLIYKLEANDKPVHTDSAIWSTHQYRFSYDENKLSFSLVAFGLQNANAYAYQYQMENFDRYPTVTSSPINISYHLPPGHYQFKVSLLNFPATTITRDIQIAAPFWEQWWFYLLSFTAFFALLLLAARTIYKRRYTAKLQTLQIRQQVLAERERISRDLHDNIGAYASAISANVDDVIYQFDASDHTTLQRLKDSAREIIVQLRDSIWALNKETQTSIMLSDRIKNYIQKLQPAYPDIMFNVDEDIEKDTALSSITALHILRIVQEAVHNSVRHSGCSHINITIVSSLHFSISVQDDGSGIPEQLVYGEGLKNMQSRSAEIGWQIVITNNKRGATILIKEGDNNIN